MGDMTIPLQIASLYHGQEVFVWSDCQLDLGTHILFGEMRTIVWWHLICTACILL